MFLVNPLTVFFFEKLFYKNANKWKKLKFDIKYSIFSISE